MAIVTASTVSLADERASGPPRGRVPELDGLRGVAILTVLVFHYLYLSINAPNHPLWQAVSRSFHLFWSGVDLFFVLSGFLISGILMDSARSPYYFKTFYLRRFHRIFPLYFGWLALFCLGVFLNLDGRMHLDHVFQDKTPLWLYPLFLQNNTGIWFGTQMPLWMAMSWSLAIEEQFYIVLPTIVRMVNRKALAVLCGATILLSPAIRIGLQARYAQTGWPFATWSRLDALAMGVALAILVRNRAGWAWLKRHSVLLRGCGIAFFAGFVAMTYADVPDRSMAAWGFSLIGVFYSVLLLLALSQPISTFGSCLRSGILQYFGRLSYALYIFHQGVHALVNWMAPPLRINAIRVLGVTGVALLVTILLAELSWRLMESKLIQRAHVRYKY